MKITLPNENRQLVSYTLKQQERVFSSTNHFHSRRAYSAAHVVADPLSVAQPVLGGEVEWEATLAYRRSLWQLGFGVAEAMDTAQRGMGLSWEHAKELIARSAREARACGGLIASGAGTDQLDQAKTIQLMRLSLRMNNKLTMSSHMEVKSFSWLVGRWRGRRNHQKCTKLCTGGCSGK